MRKMATSTLYDINNVVERTIKLSVHVVHNILKGLGDHSNLLPKPPV